MKSFRNLIASALLALAAFGALAAPAFAVETSITVRDVTGAGYSTAASAANAGGSSFQASSDQRTFLRVTNANGSPITLTIVHQQASFNAPGVGTASVPDITVTVPATTGDLLVGPIYPAYIDASGLAHITFSAVTSVSVAAFRLTR